MALNSFPNLKTSLIEWSKRSDALSMTDDFIALAESEMYANEVEPLQVRELEARAIATLAIDSRYIALPTDYNAMRRIKLNLSGGDAELRFVAPEQMRIDSATGTPCHFTVTDQIEFDRVPDDTYTAEIQYYQSVRSLSSANPENDILTKYPQIYLHGGLWALYTWALQEDKAEFHYSKFIAAIKGANKLSTKGRYGAAPYMRIEGATP